jgi:hypothetical protein
VLRCAQPRGSRVNDSILAPETLADSPAVTNSREDATALLEPRPSSISR